MIEDGLRHNFEAKSKALESKKEPKHLKVEHESESMHPYNHARSYGEYGTKDARSKMSRKVIKFR